MSQHSQLAAGSGIVPADGQRGDVFSGPSRFEAPAWSRPATVATVGVEPGSTLRRAILWRVFGPANVLAQPSGEPFARAPAGAAVVVQTAANPPPWDQFLDWVDDRLAVVDVAVAAAMGRAGGYDIRDRVRAGSAAAPLEVMCHAENRTVYPSAPAVDIEVNPPIASGFAPGDRVHMYAPSDLDPAIRVTEETEAFARFAETYEVTPWGREHGSGEPAVWSCRTRGGGLVTVMDLHTVERAPAPSGSENPAIQLFLSVLGRSPVTFGRFVVPYAHYSEFVDALADLVRRHSDVASMERIGRSAEGLDLWMLKVAPDSANPAVVFSNAVHPYEWGPIYGVLRYVNYLLERLECGGFEAAELLGDRQLWWVPCVCPDGYANRQQQPTAINLNRNFPGGWELAAPGTLHWGSYGRPHSIAERLPISLRGPGPASQPETRAMMGLLDRSDGSVVTLADFHENTGTHNFLHQYETVDGTIPDACYHAELIEGVCHAFNDRLYEQRDASFHAAHHSPTFSMGSLCGWLGYAVGRGVKGCVVEATGGDCTHYRTVRRTEYAAHVAEQVLACEHGRMVRNPWGEDRNASLTLRRGPESVLCRVYDAAGQLVEDHAAAPVPATLSRTVPAGGCLRLRYNSAKEQ